VQGVGNFETILSKIGCHGNVPWDIKKRGPDQSSAPKTLSFGEKIPKIGVADPEIICLREIIKEEEKKSKKLRKVKYIAWSAGLPSGLNEMNLELLAHLQYSPDLVPSDFHLFGSLKELLRGFRFKNNDEMFNNMSRISHVMPTKTSMLQASGAQ